MKIRLSPYSHDDLPDVLDMMSSFNAAEGYHFDPKVTEKNLTHFTSDQSLGRLFIIRMDQLNIGYLVLTFGFSFEYQGRDAFIDEFYIKESYRNMGVGKSTLAFILQTAKTLGINALHLEVESHNEKASKLYLDQGFKSNNRKLLTRRIS